MDLKNSSLVFHNQELEDAEELEERKRREEEVHTLLSNAMGGFNFDEESTINSSLASNEAENSIIHNASINKMYRESSFNDQLKVLYEAKVHENNSLTKQIDQLKKDLNDQQSTLKMQIHLLSSENKQKNISLTELQNTLVEKCQQQTKFNEEMNTLKDNINELEDKVKELETEREVLRQLNTELEKRMLVTQKGFPLLSNKVDKEFQESQRVKIQELEHALHQAQEETQHCKQQHKSLEYELRRSVSDRDKEIVENAMVINTLSSENKHLQQRLLESTKLIEEQKNKLDLASNQLIFERQKFLQQSKEEVKQTPQIENLILLNQKLKDELRQCDKEKNMLYKDLAQLQTECESLKSATLDNETLRQKIDVLEAKIDTSECGTQTNTELCEEDNSKLQTELGLEQERKALLTELQQKAVEFQKIIQERRKNLVSVGVNTMPEADPSVMKVRNDTLLYETEMRVHKKLKKEFDEKLLKALKEYGNMTKCRDCNALKEEVAKLKHAKEQDREAVYKLVTMWEGKFQKFENEAETEVLHLLDAKNKSEHDAMQMKRLLAECMEKYKKMQEYIEKHDVEHSQNYKDDFMSQTKENYTVLMKHLQRIQGKIFHFNAEIQTLREDSKLTKS